MITEKWTDNANSRVTLWLKIDLGTRSLSPFFCCFQDFFWMIPLFKVFWFLRENLFQCHWSRNGMLPLMPWVTGISVTIISWIRSSWTYSLTVLAPSTSTYTLVAPWAVSIYYSIKFTRVNLSDICLNECCFWPNVGVFSPSLVSDVSPYGHGPASIPTTWSNVSLPITMAWQEEIILMNPPLSWSASLNWYSQYTLSSSSVDERTPVSDE